MQLHSEALFIATQLDETLLEPNRHRQSIKAIVVLAWSKAIKYTTALLRVETFVAILRCKSTQSCGIMLSPINYSDGLDQFHLQSKSWRHRWRNIITNCPVELEEQLTEVWKQHDCFYDVPRFTQYPDSSYFNDNLMPRRHNLVLTAKKAYQ